jgi:predicted MFS family arabinose efflux permease
MLVAFGFTIAFGALLIAHMRDAASSNRGALALIAGIMAISTLLPFSCFRAGLTRPTQWK